MKAKNLMGLILLLSSSQWGYAHALENFEVTIKNTTKGQVLTPPVIFSHTPHFNLFEVGQKASDGIQYLAEDGATDMLVEELKNTSAVHTITAGPGVILPGQSATIKVKVPAGDRISILGMLASTNDSFYARLDLLPQVGFTRGARVYDAGTEVNNESCNFIPGPPCGSHGKRDGNGAEGFIHLSNGIQGSNDLDASQLNFQGPAAFISIQSN